MKILFIGYSNLLKVRILPVLYKTPFEEVSIAKYVGQDWDEAALQNSAVKRYDSFEEGFDNFDGELVYISIVNSRHYYYAKMSLEHGFHTIIDKPATMSLTEAEHLFQLAEEKHLLLSESTVYLYHPQIEQVMSLFREKSDTPKLITTHFTMPPFTPENFRYCKDLGGGAIMDTAPYAVSVGRYFFGTDPIEVFVSINEQNTDGLEIEYSLMMQYPDGKCLIGHFGFNTEYVNRVVLMGNRLNVAINRIYTIPDNLQNAIEVDCLNKHTTVLSEVGNTFVNYLNAIAYSLLNNDYTAYGITMLADARARQMIINKTK